ncbi:MAG: glycosyltransferase family 4 protein [Patescibacteria group bacterium]|nr:glycosyltransferase family 4 protein [Patescibacteria group bacterium]
MKILITTGIFPPDIGGPATYVENLSAELKKLGHEIEIITYGQPNAVEGMRIHGVSRKPCVYIRYFTFFINVLRHGRKADLIYTFDILSAGLPTAIANVYLRKKIFLRLGGDYLWEKAAESGQRVTLSEYYGRNLYTRGMAFRLIKLVLTRSSHIIFSTDFQRNIYLKVFPFIEAKSSVILNPFPQILKGQSLSYAEPDKIFLFAGRLIKLKNLADLIKIFVELRTEGKKIFLSVYGDGPEKDNLKRIVRESRSDEYIKIFDGIPHQGVIERIKLAYACILPSFSEISPNFGMECMKLGKPLIITRDNGMEEIFEGRSTLTNPMDREEIKKDIARLAEESDYERICPDIKEGELNRTWKDTATDTLNIIKRYVLAER